MVATGGTTSRWAAITLLAIGLAGMLVSLGLEINSFRVSQGRSARLNHAVANARSGGQVKNDAPKPAAESVAAASKSPKAATSAAQNISAPPARNVGLYVSNSPDDPAAVGVLRWAHSAGFNVVYNYSSIDGSAEQIQAYLDQAQANGIKVIISLKDLYHQLPGGAQTAAAHSQFGSSNEQIAQNIAARFGNHPAVWGFGITDEAPMDASELAAWKPILARRYQVLKSTSSKPVLAVLVGKTSPSAAARRGFLSSLKPTTDHFALDFYPIPFEPTSIIQSIGGDLAAVGDGDGWFIAQAFSWKRYPATASAIGYNPAGSRAPTTAEMVAMSKLALAGGAKNILFYSYFDAAAELGQLAALAAAVRQLR